ncbi:LPS assembly lipoprotein LptE [Methyloraptor flagellatus]|jgi:LPS-assembly lipoprotein|uniref:LPS assembly lipoprotein LptE n=1 Tax=Methyloraptor flagellatus TaxID=3162530 RepID=A0AAU7XBN9_9HYPH
MKRLLVATLALGALTGLAGCSNVRPLYGSVALPGGAAPVNERMRYVDVALMEGRVGQKIRNELEFGLSHGGETPKPLYRLDIRYTDNSTPVGVEKQTNIPAGYLVTLNASYALTDIATGKTLTYGNSFANAAYDATNQRFANVRAARDAENRAATVIAQDIRTKIAVFLATHGS